MSDLHLDTDVLKDLHWNLLTTSIAFGDVGQVADSLGEAVGHRGLQGRVQEFSSLWDDRRGEIIAALDAVTHAVKAIAQNFEEADRQIASAFETEK